MTTYPSRTLIVRTLRGASWWLALWVLLMVAYVGVHRVWHEPASPSAPFAVVVVVLAPALFASRFLMVLHKHQQRAEHVPSELETELFDLAVSVPVFGFVMLIAALRL